MFAPLEHWHEFYVLLGTAAAALVALQFVAASVGAGYLSFEKAAASRIYMTPVIVHFTSVLFASAVGLVPSHTVMTFFLTIGSASAIGFVYSAIVTIKVLQDPAVDLDDKLSYGIAPAAGYAGSVAAAAMIYLGSQHAAATLAAALLLLLIVNIRNAWDLTLYMARQHTAARHPHSEPKK
jgi:hypothetical protein